MLENEFRRLEEYVQNHIKKETKVFLFFLLFVVCCCESESGVVVVFVIAVADDMTRNR